MGVGEMMFLLVMAIVGCVAMGIMSARMTKSSFLHMRDIWRMQKAFKEKDKARKKMLEDGDMHQWISLPMGPMGTDVQICRKTGWCPSVQGYVDLEVIKTFEDQKKRNEDREKKYEEFKEKRMSEISEEYGINREKLDQLKDSIIGINKDFHLMLMDEWQEELKEKIKEVEAEDGKKDD